MFGNGIALGIAILSLPTAVPSELVTITAYPTTCGAIYTTVTSSSVLSNSSAAISTATESILSIEFSSTASSSAQSSSTQSSSTASSSTQSSSVSVPTTQSSLTESSSAEFSSSQSGLPQYPLDPYTTTSSTTEQFSTTQTPATYSPTPVSDVALNEGSIPFVLQINPGVPGRKRQAGQATYIDADGYVTANASQAVQYVIGNGTLTSTAGGWVSTYEGVNIMPFAMSSIRATIDTVFAFEDLKLHWNNTAFDGGAAQFYTVPASTSGAPAQVVLRLAGPIQSNFKSVTFAVQPAAELFVESSSAIDIATTPIIVPVESVTAPSSAIASVTSSVAIEDGQEVTTAIIIPSSTTANVAPSGTCGPEVGTNCYGAFSGNCCSTFGFCGSGPEYCGSGCQPGFGICDTLLASSSASEASSAVSSSSTLYYATESSVAPISSSEIYIPTNFFSTFGTVSSSGPTPLVSSASFSTAIGSQYVSVSTSSFASSAVTLSSELPSSTLPIYFSTASPVVPNNPSPSSEAEQSSTSSTSSSVTDTTSVSSLSTTSTFMSSITNLEVFPSIVPDSTTSASSVTDLEVFPSIVPDPTSTASSLTDLEVFPSIVPDITTTSTFSPSSASVSADSSDSSMVSSSSASSSSSSSSTSTMFSSSSSSSATISSTVPLTTLSSSSSSSSSSLSLASLENSAPMPILPSSDISILPYSTTTTSSASATSNSVLSSSTPVIVSSYILSASSASSSLSSASSSYLVLTSPTACNFGDPPTFDEDDSYERIDLPQPMYIGTSSSTASFAAVNGLLSITLGTAEYQYNELPSTELPAGTVAPYWADLAVYRINATGPAQGLFYQLDASGVTYEWYLNRAGNRNITFHFTVQYRYANPGIFTYTYYDVGDGENGALATVGLQTSTTSGYTMSYNSTGNITPGLVVTCDTNTNTCTRPAPS
ncbi:hypothetical protein CLAFUW4_13159 [Fulvia fulva]|nr:hypothetical protein CLAFUR4_13164 [Fulvia fulva]WPV21317.1 hypothetical protein CLAFUW4_13159 [Fulvia fulva]WPV36536.1 hypothetical protein CLAFUW7_13167 [Fulvia fulva]